MKGRERERMRQRINGSGLIELSWSWSFTTSLPSPSIIRSHKLPPEELSTTLASDLGEAGFFVVAGVDAKLAEFGALDNNQLSPGGSAQQSA